MDRNDLIKALGEAFTEPQVNPEEVTESRVEMAVAGEKDVLRLLADPKRAETYDLIQRHPDVHSVSKLVETLTMSGEREVASVAKELTVRFNQAVESHDDLRIEEIVQQSKEILMRLNRYGKNSPELALAYMQIIDTIKKM